MATSKTRTADTAHAPSAKQTLSAVRLQFLAEAPATAKLRREFTQPRRAVAVEEAVELAELPSTQAGSEAIDQCWVVFLPPGTSNELLQKAMTWLASPNSPDSAPPVVIEHAGMTIRWQPGRALVQGRADHWEDVLSALVDFTFYEGELRTLEAAVESREGQAQSDVAIAHRIRYRDRRHWQRFGDTIEYLTQLRLTYARLEPRLAKAPRTLAIEGRRVMARLLNKADAESRLEALSERLEALEDLYEGANDRVADFRWYRHGHILEVGIILLLLVECVVVSCELTMHYQEYQRDSRGDSAAANLSEEFRATITKVAEGTVSMTTEKGFEKTLPVAANLKVFKGKIDADTKEVTASEAIPGGLKDEQFTRAVDQGSRMNILTDSENKRIAAIYILSPAATKRGK